MFSLLLLLCDFCFPTTDETSCSGRPGSFKTAMGGRRSRCFDFDFDLPVVAEIIFAFGGVADEDFLKGEEQGDVAKMILFVSIR